MDCLEDGAELVSPQTKRILKKLIEPERPDELAYDVDQGRQE